MAFIWEFCFQGVDVSLWTRIPLIRLPQREDLFESLLGWDALDFIGTGDWSFEGDDTCQTRTAKRCLSIRLRERTERVTRWLCWLSSMNKACRE